MYIAPIEAYLKMEDSQLEKVIRASDILADKIKSEAHIGEWTRERMLKELSEERERQIIRHEKSMQELRDSREKSIKQAIDFAWAHVIPEQLEREMNQRYRDAGMNTRISIEVHRQ